MDDETAVLRSTTGESLALLGVAAKGTVNGLFFDLAVEQRYRNPAATNIEAVYTFPLPTGAVLLDFQVTIGGKLLTGIVVEKKAAEAQYEEAIEKGDTAIMLERAGSGLCTVNLGNLMAGESSMPRPSTAPRSQTAGAWLRARSLRHCRQTRATTSATAACR